MHYIQSNSHSSSQINLGHIPVLPGLIPGPPEPITTLPMVHLGTLSNGAHDVSGSVFALADRTLMLKDFNYDGTAPGKIADKLSKCTVNGETFARVK